MEMEADYHSTRLPPDPRRDRVWRVLARRIQSDLAGAGTVVDLGAGYCGFINHIEAPNRVAIDVWSGVTSHAAPGVKAQVGPCTDLSFLASDSVDAVFASNLLEHLEWPDIERTCVEVRRVLRTKGRWILLQPNFRYCAREYFDDHTHRTIWTHVGLADYLAGAGFRVVRMIPRWVPFSMRNRWVPPEWLIGLYLSSPIRPGAAQMYCVAEAP